MNRVPLSVVIVTTTLSVAWFDLWTPAELIGAALFTFPLVMCAWHASTRLLWGTAAAAGLLTIAAEFLGVNRAELLHPWLSLTNRGLMAASLLTLATFIHLRSKHTQRAMLDTAALARQSGDLLEKTKQVDSLVISATNASNVRQQAERHLVQMEGKHQTTREALLASEESYRLLVDGIEDYAIFMMDPQGQILSWNAGAERLKGYTAEEIVGLNFACFFPAQDIQRGKPALILKLAAASGRHEELGMRVRKDGSQFLARVIFTPLLDANGKLRGFSELSHDLSESKESEAKYRGLLEAAPDAMVVVDGSGAIVLLNLQAEKQFGYYRGELVGQPLTNIIPAGFAERLLADQLRSEADALAQQIGTGIELTGKRKDGTEFPIEIMLSPLKSPEGVLVTAAIRDISVRQAAQNEFLQMTRELSSKHRLLDSIFEGTTDPIYVRDLENCFTLANSAAAELFGLSAQQIVGKNLRELLPNDSFHAVAESDRETARTGATRTVEEIAEIGGVTRIYLTTKGPYRDADQHTIGTVGIARDITAQREQQFERLQELKRDIEARKEAERHLVQLESRYRGLLEAAPAAMVISDAQGCIVLVNAETERLFGYVRTELVGQPVETLLPERYRATHPQHRNAYTANPSTRAMGIGRQLRARRKDGTEFAVEIMLSPVQFAGGILVTAAILDITERHKAEEQLLQTLKELKRSNDELEHFAYIASHDLQEPLRMVASYTQLLAKRYKGRLDADADEFIAYAVDGSNRMQSLIQDLLAYSQAGTSGKALREVASENALQKALANLRNSIEESGAVVTHDSLPLVTTDPTQLTQVLQNLVGNAIKYRGVDTPQVHISAANGGNEWVFAVRDNGLGIDPQYFERIFILFQRLHTREEFHGTGIGLAICKKMLERLGGRIWVESQPQKGSTFYFALPQR